MGALVWLIAIMLFIAATLMARNASADDPDPLCAATLELACDQYVAAFYQYRNLDFDYGQLQRRLNQCQASFQNTLESFREIYFDMVEVRERDEAEIRKLKRKVRALRRGCGR